MKNTSMAATTLFTSESVAPGHPDKVADYISDSLLDATLALDPEARVAAETLVTENLVVLAGEIRARAVPDFVAVARQAIVDLGIDEPGFNPQTVEIQCHVHEQSAEIAQGVDATTDKAEGAGDQGIMFGYACNETPVLMPAPIYYAHRLLEACAARRLAGLSWLRPDAKAQVTLEYQGHQPVRVHTLLLSHQHTRDATQADVLRLLQAVAAEVFPTGWVGGHTRLLANPTGSFILGGPAADTGLTGRKIIVDSYGGAARHGGGAFSGKDPTKVDRSAAYAARYLAKNIVAAGLAERCEIQLGYAIGVAEPLAIYLETFGTLQKGLTATQLERALRASMPLTPQGIRTHLGLNRPIYRPTAHFGHFGRTPGPAGEFSWEKTDLVPALLRGL